MKADLRSFEEAALDLTGESYALLMDEIDFLVECASARLAFLADPLQGPVIHKLYEDGLILLGFLLMKRRLGADREPLSASLQT